MSICDSRTLCVRLGVSHSRTERNRSTMTITPGYTVDEIRDFVYQYEKIPHGHKTLWLLEQEFSRHQFRKWRLATFNGDLDRGLIPRSKVGKVPYNPRQLMQSAIEDNQAKRIAELEARNAQLEAANEALGKAIGLLHDRNAQEPESTPTRTVDDS